MHPTPHPTGAASADFAHQIAAMRPMLVSLARRAVRNDSWAEDAVSEALVAALERPETYQGRAQARTWVVGILKHKLVDQVRRQTRECPYDALVDSDDDADADERLPAAGPGDGPAWGDPVATLARRQFVRQVDAELARLPARQSRAFVLAACLEQETDEVCEALDVTPNHLGVILHRTRSRLRDAMAPQWRRDGSARLV
ncbi:MAG: sigma-70 family RNA polymerase sigma factor [Rubrivivax sp.]|nr:sigma-70 family RNA polymerase sigma factor [Rubrivivax sp.]